MLGELGVLHLARGDYASSLDALLRAGFWADAAYVAERVLTLEELEAYVQRNWPEPPRPTAAQPAPGAQAADKRGLYYRDQASFHDQASFTPVQEATMIRYLLARRLARARERI